MPEVTTATLADIPQLVGLLTILFTHEVELAPDPAKQERALRLIIEQPDQGRIFCMREGERVLGMVSILFTVSTAEGGRSGWLEDMVIRPDRRNMGLGTRLLQHAVAYAKSHGFTRITLLTDKINEKTIRFYEKNGFQHSEMVPMRLHLG